MAHFYSVGGRTGATLGTADHGIAALWNPSSTIPIWFVSYTFEPQAVGTNARHKWQRITTRGTAGSTVTPDINNDYDDYAAPASGALLDLATYSVHPTLSTPIYFRQQVEAGIGVSFIVLVPPKPILIRPGEGFAAIVPDAAAVGVGDVTIEFYE